MSNVKIKLDRRGIRKLLRSQEMQHCLNSIAFSAASRLGEGYEANYYTAKTRAVAEVAAVSQKARKENSDTNSILKALK